MSRPFDYSKWDNIELSDDEDDLHPNIDKDSWFRMKHKNRVEKEDDDGKKKKALDQKLATVKDALKVYSSNPDHTKAKKLRKEAEEIEAQLAKIEKETTWNADNMCKTVEDRAMVSESGGRAEPKPEPRLSGEDVAKGYCEFVEEHEELLERYIALGSEDLEAAGEFLKLHGGVLLEGEHAESYVLLDCLEKEMNGFHDQMLLAARQNQLLTQLREFSRASGRPVRDAVHPIITKLLNDESAAEAFEDAVRNFVERLERRAVVKKAEIDAEAAEAEPAGLGPGGLDPNEVMETLPDEMRQAFLDRNMARLAQAVESLDEEEARYHLQRCEDSGLWVPHQAAGVPPYRQ